MGAKTDTAVDEALRNAHAQAARLDRDSRVLVVLGIAGMLLVAAWFIAGFAAPALPALAVLAVGSGLAPAVAAAGLLCVALHAHGLEKRIARERVLAHAQLMAVLAHTSPATATATASASASASAGASASASALARRVVAGVAIATAIGAIGWWTNSSAQSARAPKSHRWTFVESAALPSDLGLHSHVAEGGAWALEDDAHATGARALVSREGDLDARPGIVTATGFRARDLRATTRCKASSTKETQSCGLVFRFQDVANHLVARIDAVRGELVVLAVTGGSERVLGSMPVAAKADVWQEISVEAHRGRIRATWNGASTLEVRDGGPTRSGAIGIWAPSAAEASFDELAVEVDTHPRATG